MPADDERGRRALVTRFRENLGFLVKSARAFDSGDHAEALRMATGVRTLSYDGGYGQSILTQLGAKPRMQWRSFYVPFGIEVPAGTPTFGSSLYGLVLGAGGSSHPGPVDLGAESRYVPYEDWWDGEPVVQFGTDSITREQLVLGLANQDGGAHVDLHGKHITALFSGSPRLAFEDGTEPPEDTQEAFQRDLLQIQMRTVANEVTHSIANAQRVGLL